MRLIGGARDLLSTAVYTTGSLTWRAAKFSATQCWNIFPYKGAAHKALKVSKWALYGTAGFCTAELAYRASQSELAAASLSMAGEALQPVREIAYDYLGEPIYNGVSAAADLALTGAKELVVESLSKAASIGVSGIVHFIACRILSVATTSFKAFGLFFDVFKRMDTPAQIMVGGGLLLRFGGSRLTKKMHTFCIGPNLPSLAQRGASSCQSPLSALIEKKVKRFLPWLKNKEEIKPILNKDIKAQVEPFIEANKKIAAGGDGFFRNMLLLGSPGTGKTMLAKYIARESGMNYIEIDGSTFARYEQWQEGLALKLLKEVFEYIQQSGRPVLVLIDEADGLLQRPDAIKDPRVKQSDLQFRSALLAATGVNNKLMLVLTTNHPDKMDRALLSRVQVKVNIPPPDLDSRVEILTKYIDQHFKKRSERATCLNDEKIKELAEKTEGMSGRDLLFLVDNFVVAQTYSRAKTLTPEMIADMLDLSLHSFREEYKYNAAQAAPLPATQPAQPAPPPPATQPLQVAVEPATPSPAEQPLQIVVEPVMPLPAEQPLQAAQPPATPSPEAEEPLQVVVEPVTVPEVEISAPEKPTAKTVESLGQKIANFVALFFSKIKEMFSAIGRFFSFSRAISAAPVLPSVRGVLDKQAAQALPSA